MRLHFLSLRGAARRSNPAHRVTAVLHAPRAVLVGFIRLYQQTLSPDHSRFMKPFFPNGYCRFHPTCSEYGRQAIMRFGIFFGSIKTIWRILRCNPFSKGGVDELGKT